MIKHKIPVVSSFHIKWTVLPGSIQRNVRSRNGVGMIGANYPFLRNFAELAFQIWLSGLSDASKSFRIIWNTWHLQTHHKFRTWASAWCKPAGTSVPLPSPFHMNRSWATALPRELLGICPLVSSGEQQFSGKLLWKGLTGPFPFCNFLMKSSWFYISLCMYTKYSTYTEM